MKNFNLKKLLALALAVMMTLSMVACAGNSDNQETTGETNPEASNTPEVEKTYTFNDYLTACPSNWNELTYQDANDTEIMDYIQGSFFTYDFKFDENGEIVPGEYEMKYSAATNLEDVSADYVGDEWGISEGATGRAWKITLRDDLKWDDGTPIHAEDFVYSMQEQLNPLFQNYRADSYYVGSTVIVNAKNYAKQGQSGWFGADSVYSEYTEDMDASLIFTLAPDSDDVPAHAYVRDSFGFPDSYDAAATAEYLINNYIGECAFTVETAAAMEGKTLAEIKADETLSAAWNDLIGWWQTEPNEELHFFVAEYTYPEIDFSTVGLFVGDNENELIIVLEKSLPLTKEDGSLSYHAAYNMSSLPLVKKDLYESCKIAPDGASSLWTSNYNSSVETSASWGPYKLESFQTGTQFVLVRNDNWYGYNIAENEGLYQTDRRVVNIVEEWNSAWLMFLAGEVDGISIDVSIADDYKGSERTYFTPSSFISSVQIQSDAEQLKARETDGYNKTILTYKDFRKAMSLAINRTEYTTKCTTASKAGFGIFNSMHYYDVENGGVYRNTDEAKQTLCNVYAVDVSQYDSLDDAADSITGYNLDMARELVTSAYNEALANGDIKENDKIMLTFGSSTINEAVTRQFNFLANAWTEMLVGTPLEGRLETEYKEYSDSWANDFRAGAYDICTGGWQGAAWDPGYFLLAYLDSGYMYSKAWDTTTQEMTFTMKGVAEDGGDITETMSLHDWYDCLNGTGAYDWSSNALEESQRLQLIAALEEQILNMYYTVPVAYSFSASMLSYKVDYITYEYNTFMGYGGMKYMTYNYDDAEWAAVVAENNGELNYK